jgi:hypothetical protein
VVDTGVTMDPLLISLLPIFQGDGEHIHHMLLARGWTQRLLVLILYGVCATFGLLAAISTTTSSPITGFVLFVIAVAVIIAVGHLRYHEVDELRAGVKRTVGDRRVRVANNIRVRRASLALSKASNLNELFEALGLMLEFEEFAYAHVQLSQPGCAEINERAFNASNQRRSTQRLKFRNGRILWSWNRNGVHEDDVVGSSAFWSVRLPLSTGSRDLGWINLYRPFDGPPLLLDTNYLSGFLRTDLAEAARRILQSYEKPLDTGTVPVPMTAEKVAG